jgi:hypothetical protein
VLFLVDDDFRFLAWKRRKLRDEMRQASKKAEERQVKRSDDAQSEIAPVRTMRSNF